MQLATARKLMDDSSETPKALQASECNELPYESELLESHPWPGLIDSESVTTK